MKFLILALVGSVLGDGGEHHHPHAPQAAAAATADTYGSPQEAPVYQPQYAAPQYGAPLQDEYGVPSQDYAASAQEYGSFPTGYDAPAPGYDAPAPLYDAPVPSYNPSEPKEHFDLSVLFEFVPIILAVLAAIIIAQLFAPLLGILFGAKFSLLSGIFSPVTTAKIGLFNTLLAPFNVALCDITTAATPVVLAGRSADSGSGFSMDKDTIDIVANMLYKAIDNYSSV